jgi:glycine/serine hydroxymethyltransferase
MLSVMPVVLFLDTSSIHPCELVLHMSYSAAPQFRAGKIFEKVCEACHISINKTPIYGDNGSISPGGVRIG